MAQAAFHICRPNEKLRFQYTTSSSNLQKKLGVASKIIAIDRNGKEHALEGRDGWTVMEILRDGGLRHRGGMRRRLRLRHLPCLCD